MTWTPKDLVTASSEPPKRGRGRGTKEEEAWDYLLSQGIDPADVLAGSRDTIEIPDDPAKIVEAFTVALYTQMTRGELKGTALVQGLKAVAEIAKVAKNEPDKTDTAERGIDEILADAGLPTERRQEIGRVELGRLHSRAAALELVLETIGATA